MTYAELFLTFSIKPRTITKILCYGDQVRRLEAQLLVKKQMEESKEKLMVMSWRSTRNDKLISLEVRRVSVALLRGQLGNLGLLGLWLQGPACPFPRQIER